MISDAAIAHQVDFYFSPVNLSTDKYLHENMDAERWVPLDLIVKFPRMERMGATNKARVAAAIRSHSKVVEVDPTSERVRPTWCYQPPVSAPMYPVSAFVPVAPMIYPTAHAVPTQMGWMPVQTAIAFVPASQAMGAAYSGYNSFGPHPGAYSAHPFVPAAENGPPAGMHGSNAHAFNTGYANADAAARSGIMDPTPTPLRATHVGDRGQRGRAPWIGNKPAPSQLPTRIPDARMAAASPIQVSQPLGGEALSNRSAAQHETGNVKLDDTSGRGITPQKRSRRFNRTYRSRYDARNRAGPPQEPSQKAVVDKQPDLQSMDFPPLPSSSMKAPATQTAESASSSATQRTDVRATRSNEAASLPTATPGVLADVSRAHRVWANQPESLKSPQPSAASDKSPRLQEKQVAFRDKAPCEESKHPELLQIPRPPIRDEDPQVKKDKTSLHDKSPCEKGNQLESLETTQPSTSDRAPHLNSDNVSIEDNNLLPEKEEAVKEAAPHSIPSSPLTLPVEAKMSSDSLKVCPPSTPLQSEESSEETCSSSDTSAPESNDTASQDGNDNSESVPKIRVVHNAWANKSDSIFRAGPSSASPGSTPPRRNPARVAGRHAQGAGGEREGVSGVNKVNGARWKQRASQVCIATS